jgi:hypothetical protein
MSDNNNNNLELENELKIVTEQIYNLENILDNTDINLKTPELDFLTDMYNNLKTLTKEERNKFISEISAISIGNINPNNKKYNTMTDKQRIFVLERLKEKKSEFEKKLGNI